MKYESCLKKNLSIETGSSGASRDDCMPLNDDELCVSRQNAHSLYCSLSLSFSHTPTKTQRITHSYPNSQVPPPMYTRTNAHTHSLSRTHAHTHTQTHAHNHITFDLFNFVHRTEAATDGLFVWEPLERVQTCLKTLNPRRRKKNLRSMKL